MKQRSHKSNTLGNRALGLSRGRISSDFCFRFSQWFAAPSLIWKLKPLWALISFLIKLIENKCLLLETDLPAQTIRTALCGEDRLNTYNSNKKKLFLFIWCSASCSGSVKLSRVDAVHFDAEGNRAGLLCGSGEREVAFVRGQERSANYGKTYNWMFCGESLVENWARVVSRNTPLERSQNVARRIKSPQSQCTQ